MPGTTAILKMLPMIAFEAYFGLGQLGFLGGGQPGAGMALRQFAAERTAYVPDFVLRMWQIGLCPSLTAKRCVRPPTA